MRYNFARIIAVKIDDYLQNIIHLLHINTKKNTCKGKDSNKTRKQQPNKYLVLKLDFFVQILHLSMQLNLRAVGCISVRGMQVTIEFHKLWSTQTLIPVLYCWEQTRIDLVVKVYLIETEASVFFVWVIREVVRRQVETWICNDFDGHRFSDNWPQNSFFFTYSPLDLAWIGPKQTNVHKGSSQAQRSAFNVWNQALDA